MNTLAKTALAATTLTLSAPGHAAYVAYMDEIGNDVIVTGSGSFNLDGLTYSTTGQSGTAGIIPANSFLNIGTTATIIDSYGSFATFSSPEPFGTGSGAAGIGTGPQIAITAASLIVPTGYLSGAALGSTTATFANHNFTSLGVTPGSYTWSWGSGATADSFTLNIGQDAPIPAPPALALLGLGLLGLTASRRTRT